jgi:predicted phage terminase large subunit-like protein
MINKTDKAALERYLAKLELIKSSGHVRLNESAKEKSDRIARAKKDYNFMVNYYFPHYATSECAGFQIEAAEFINAHDDCIDAEIWPRAHAKTTHLTIFLPFWLWMNRKLDVFLLFGKNAEDAKTLLSDLQAEFEGNPQIIADFGEQKKAGSWEEGQFVTLDERAFFSLGRGQSPRGIRYRNKRPNFVVFSDIDDDEIVNNPRRVLKVIKWIFGAVHGAMDNKGSRMVFDNNLFSNTGITAYVIKKIKALRKENKNKSARVNIIAALDKKGNPTWHQKYTRSFFERKRQVMGDFSFQSEYMNNPQVEGKIFLDEQIQWAQLPRLDHFECIIGHWDVAYAGTETGDYNAVKVWGLKDSKFYCIAAFVRQCKMAQAMQWMVDFERQLPKAVKVHWRFESQFWNDALRMTLEEVNKAMKQLDGEKYQLNLIQCERPVTNKFNRILGLQPYYQNGRIYYNKKEEFNVDMQVGINQLKGIEPGYNSHDDSPDADEAAISFLSKFIPTNNPLPIVGNRGEGRSLW